MELEKGKLIVAKLKKLVDQTRTKKLENSQSLLAQTDSMSMIAKITSTQYH